MANRRRGVTLVLVLALALAVSSGAAPADAPCECAASRYIALPRPHHERVVPDLSGYSEGALPHVARQVLAAERQGRGRKVISTSLFSSTPRYVQGAIENAVLARRDWPDWTFRIYYGDGVPHDVLAIVESLGGELVDVRNYTEAPHVQGGLQSMFWRIWALEDPTATRVIVRDVDSRLTPRDHATVDDWVASDALFHTAHDHPNLMIPVPGGTWGAVGGLLNPRLFQEWRAHHQDLSTYTVDQDWLAQVVWPLVQDVALDHASFSCGGWWPKEWRPFPVQRKDATDVVGNRYNVTPDNYQGLRLEGECPELCRKHPDWKFC